MPFLTREQFQFAIILLAVPCQYFIVQRMGSNEVTRSYAISQMVNQLKDFQTRWFRIEPWRKWCQNLIYLITEGEFHSLLYDIDSGSGAAVDDLGESPAYEVIKFRDKDGYFARSTKIRNPKNPEVKYRVGQVVRHKKWKYTGVIIGWDETAKAPEDWLKEMHGKNEAWRNQPNYGILVDTRDRSVPQMTYVPQESLQNDAKAIPRF